MKVLVAMHGFGDILQETHLASMAEIYNTSNTSDQWEWMCPSRDALISRLRSSLLTIGLGEGTAKPETPYDVEIWLDRDIVWAPGDLKDLADRCAQAKGVVGSLYPFRVKGAKGFPWRAKRPADGKMPEIRIGDDKLYEAEYVGGGFCAFWMPAIKQALPRMLETDDPFLKVSKCIGNGGMSWFYDFCRPVSVPRGDGLHDYLSDDWVAMYRFSRCGIPIYCWPRPFLSHIGNYTFTPEDATKCS